MVRFDAEGAVRAGFAGARLAADGFRAAAVLLRGRGGLATLLAGAAADFAVLAEGLLALTKGRLVGRLADRFLEALAALGRLAPPALAPRAVLAPAAFAERDCLVVDFADVRARRLELDFAMTNSGRA